MPSRCSPCSSPSPSSTTSFSACNNDEIDISTYSNNDNNSVEFPNTSNTKNNAPQELLVNWEDCFRYYIKCPFCVQTTNQIISFSSEKQHRDHHRKVHTKDIGFKCQELMNDCNTQCATTSTSWSNFNAHLASHRNIGAFVCTIPDEYGNECGKTASTKFNLIKHIEAVHYVIVAKNRDMRKKKKELCSHIITVDPKKILPKKRKSILSAKRRKTTVHNEFLQTKDKDNKKIIKDIDEPEKKRRKLNNNSNDNNNNNNNINININNNNNNNDNVIVEQKQSQIYRKYFADVDYLHCPEPLINEIERCSANISKTINHSPLRALIAVAKIAKDRPDLLDSLTIKKKIK